MRWLLLSLLLLYPNPTHASVDVLDNNASCTSIVNSSAETEVYGYDLPANTIDDAYRGVIHVRVFGSVINFTGALKTITWRIKFGGATHYQDTYNIGSVNVANPDFLDLYIAKYTGSDRFANLTGIHHYGNISSNPTTGFGRMAASSQEPAFQGTELLEWLNVANRVSVTVQFSAASSNLSYSCYHGSTLKE